jgi:hypothetical protein
MMETVPSFERLLALLTETWQKPVTVVPVDLMRYRPIQVPPTSGSIELALSYDGEPVGRVVATAPATQWDWQAVTGRAVDAVWHQAQGKKLELLMRDRERASNRPRQLARVAHGR